MAEETTQRVRAGRTFDSAYGFSFSIAVAEARNGACTACFMALRPQIMADVRRGNEVITCDNCNRILYYEPNNAAQPVAVS